MQCTLHIVLTTVIGHSLLTVLFQFLVGLFIDGHGGVIVLITGEVHVNGVISRLGDNKLVILQGL